MKHPIVSPAEKGEKPYGNITVRLERPFIRRLEALEATSRLSKSEITRQCLEAALRQFERTGKLLFPMEIADLVDATESSPKKYSFETHRVAELMERNPDAAELGRLMLRIFNQPSA